MYRPPKVADRVVEHEFMHELHQNRPATTGKASTGDRTARMAPDNRRCMHGTHKGEPAGGDAGCETSGPLMRQCAGRMKGGA